MGTRIEAVATRVGRSGRLGRGGTALAAAAARRALARAGRSAADVDLLLWSGVYRDGSVAEPAIASLVQKRLGARERFPARDGRTAFAFDVVDGAAGVPTAADVAGGFLACGVAERALIVACDVDPTPGRSRGAGFDRVGAALLLASGDDGEGFEAFRQETFSKHADLREGRLEFVAGRAGRRAHHALRVHEDERFASAAGTCLALAAEALLAERGLAPDDLDLVVAPGDAPELRDTLAERLRLPRERVFAGAARLRAPVTSPLRSLEEAMASEAWRRARRVLWAAVGAGITVSLALYRRRPA
jgi:3-oxoacyl-[acyl-carrier-protein] synthase-3